MPGIDRTFAPRLHITGGALVFLATVVTLVLLSRSPGTSVLPYVASLVVGGALTSYLLWRPAKISGLAVLAVAAIGHGIALYGHTVFEDDFYRFIWDGWRLLETGTPYGIPPEDFIDNPAVPPAMRDILEWINYPYYPTIYGPVLQVIFAITTFFAGANELGLRFVFAAAALGLTALLLRKYSGDKVALFAWNPLVVAESTLHLHPDIFLGFALLATVVAGRKHPIIAGTMLGIAACVKLVALAAWPLLLRLKPSAMIAAVATTAGLYGVFAVQGHGIGLDSTETFATQWYFNPYAYEPLFRAFGPTWGRLATLAIAAVLVVWLHARARGFEVVPLAAVFGVILLFAPAVNAWYLLWLLPLALGRKEVWPYVASAVLPLSYLTGLNLEDFSLEEFQVHPLAQYAQWGAIAAAILYDLWRGKRARGTPREQPALNDKIDHPQISVVIPALNEEASIGPTVRGIRSAGLRGLCEVIVADNSSTDQTAAKAAAAGARVIAEHERGYGAACLAALDALDPKTNIILFMDADLSDVPEEASELVKPIVANNADLVIGSRTLGAIEPGAMSVPQRFGNWLAPALVRLIWGVRYTDLGPYRAIRRDALDRLAMADRDFGWTIEMQVRAAKQQMRITERPARYRRRVGVSKISGTARGVIAAGCKILFVIGREAFGDFDRAGQTKGGRLAKPTDQETESSQIAV
ncbi:glycosyltransferase [Erythrobacter sp. W53]|uniref:glycosyltransferase n=1 Tax=Erythrobacter sp. W53 TaxID=3425947 RepID=UPI003D769527